METEIKRWPVAGQLLAAGLEPTTLTVGAGFPTPVAALACRVWAGRERVRGAGVSASLEMASLGAPPSGRGGKTHLQCMHVTACV